MDDFRDGIKKFQEILGFGSNIFDGISIGIDKYFESFMNEPDDIFENSFNSMDSSVNRINVSNSIRKRKQKSIFSILKNIEDLENLEINQKNNNKINLKEEQLKYKNEIKKISEELNEWINKFIQEKICGNEEKLTLFCKNEKVKEKFIEKMKKEVKVLKKLNILLIGQNGVGKSTLINALLREDLVKEGLNEKFQKKGQKYQSKKYPFLCLINSIATQTKDINDTETYTINSIMEKMNDPDPNEHIHCIIYCVTLNNMNENELKLILNIREIYKGDKLPVVVALTRGKSDTDFKKLQQNINEYIKYYKINDNMFDISFNRVYAKEEQIQKDGKKHYQKCFGLRHLITICFERINESYKFLIRHSLLQLNKKFINNYIKKINEEIKNIINNEKTINDKEIPKTKNFFPLDLYECIICEKEPEQPLKCNSCKRYICEECYTKQFTNGGTPLCNKCNDDNFVECSEEDKMLISDYFNNNLINKRNNNNNIIINNNLENYSLKKLVQQLVNDILLKFNDKYKSFKKKLEELMSKYLLLENKKDFEVEIEKVENVLYSQFKEYILRKTSQILIKKIIDLFEKEKYEIYKLKNDFFQNYEFEQNLDEYKETLRQIEKDSYKKTENLNKSISYKKSEKKSNDK